MASHPNPEIRGRGGGLKKVFFLALQASAWFLKNPLPWINHCYPQHLEVRITERKLSLKSLKRFFHLLINPQCHVSIGCNNNSVDQLS